MGTKRVYELAKEMGLENKELLAKLEEAGIEGKSHSSSLSDDELAALTHSKTPTEEKIEESRIKPGIIRRRRTVVNVPEPEPEVAPVVEAPVVAPNAEEVEPLVAKTATSVSDSDVGLVNEPEQPAVAKTKVKPTKETQSEVDALGKTPSQPVSPAAAEPLAESSANRAIILGRVELPKPAPPAQRRPSRPQDRPERAGRPEGAAARPGSARPTAHPGSARPSTHPGSARPASARPGGGSSLPNVMAPVAPPSEKEDTRSKRKKKSRNNSNESEADGRVSRRGRQVEVFEPSRMGQRRKLRKGEKALRKTEITISKAIKRVIRITDSITVGELAKRMGIKANEIISELMRQGTMVSINHPLDFETAVLIASEFSYEVENVAFDEDIAIAGTGDKASEELDENLQSRPPVVTIMGHVDHGKTSLLDAIREAKVTEGEAGGITQHIGAYDVELEGRKITFLDTPGHEAFTAMRARGAGVTDIVVLVVAADDGVMPQTKEAINHSKAAGVPIIVAINKVDKPDANPDRVKQELTEFELVPEEWGGVTIFVEVSAKAKTNIDTLLEMILLQAEILELKANPDKNARGSIVEARLDKGRGAVATVLVKEGTLKVGDHIVAGTQYGRVRSMTNAAGLAVKEAGPSFPVEVTGLAGVPHAGDLFHAVDNEKTAREVSMHRQQKQREIELSKTSKVSLEQLFAKMQEGEVEELAVIIKADVQGSVEAVRESLLKLTTSNCRLNVIHTGVGGINESDVTLANASNAIVLGFNVRPEVKAKALAESEEVDIRLYSVIYDAVNDIRDAMEGLLAPTLRERELGRVEVRDTFHVSRVGTIAGCYVTEGKILRNAQTRLVRDSVVVWEGKLHSLKRFKDDAKEVASGYECGIGLENYNDIKVGDIIEVFEIESVKTSL
ncbi:translation initiation factor IF-2 [Geopsychrobacter electrodiphilus]|uniref:translation initiation factor IF-2 n=1 Tax=Geopsychrobacter electrodiphilus TaxID=225196 RepID=UPI0003746EC2|nr:translation initiation factor IF-2 [Geopsychrobacter electrodiphilus]